MEELKEMCRVCMAEAEDLIDMYDKKKTHIEDRLSAALKRTQEPEPSLPDLLKECSPICVKPDDSFPQKVCDPCLRKMRDAVYFHRRYAKSMEYIGRVKMEKNDQAIINDLELEEWDLKNANEEEDEDQENMDEDEDEDSEDEYEEDEDAEDELYNDEEEPDDFEDDEEEYIPTKTMRKQAQLTEHNADHSREFTKQNGLNTRPKRRSAKY